eukprot:413152-Pyramimonas_sp.AAC.2
MLAWITAQRSGGGSRRSAQAGRPHVRRIPQRQKRVPPSEPIVRIPEALNSESRWEEVTPAVVQLTHVDM